MEETVTLNYNTIEIEMILSKTLAERNKTILMLMKEIEELRRKIDQLEAKSAVQ
jgi:hypothetical protein